MPNAKTADSETNSSVVDDSTPLDVAEDNQQETASESSTEADGKEVVTEGNWNPLSVVKKALEEESKPKDSDTGTDKTQPGQSSKSENENQKSDAEEELGEITEEELKGYKAPTRKRIERLLDDRRKLSEEVESLKPEAQSMQTFKTFLEEGEIETKDAVDALLVLRMSKSSKMEDRHLALKNAKMFVSQLEQQLGEVIPDDLQKKINDGDLDGEAAKEVAKARAIANISQEQTQKMISKAERNNEATVKAQADQAVTTSISKWQETKTAQDPEFSRKAELLKKEIDLRVMREVRTTGKRIDDATRAVAIAEEAYAEVNRLFKALVPNQPAQEKKVLRSRILNETLTKKANTPLEAAQMALDKMSG